MEKAKIIKDMFEKKGFNAKVFSEKAGIPYTTLRSILERGVSKSSVENIIKICRALGITVEDLERMASGLTFTPVGDMVSLPIYGKISCGNGIIAYESIEGYEATPKEWLNGGEYFYLRAKGDSMTGARINEGDLLLIRKQQEVENGEIAAVLIGEDAILKKVYKNGETILLQSENPAYPPIFCPPSEAVIIGKLKMVTIKF